MYVNKTDTRLYVTMHVKILSKEMEIIISIIYTKLDVNTSGSVFTTVYTYSSISRHRRNLYRERERVRRKQN